MGNAVDVGGQNHPDKDGGQAAQGIIKAAEGIGLESHLKVRSSDSRGCWIIWPLPEKVKAYQAAERLKVALETAGYSLAPGHLEIFPNLKSKDAIYNMHRVPLQQGSYLLDDNWQPGSEDIKVFMREWHRAATCQDLELFRSSSKTASPNPKPASPKLSPARPENGQFNLASRMRWTGPGQSNRNIGAIVAYVVETEKLRSPEEIERRVWRLMEAGDYYKWASEDEQRDRAHVRQWIRTRLRRSWGYSGKRGGNTNPNEVRADAATERLEVALAELADQTWKTSNEIFQAVCRVLKEKFGMGISKQTWQARKSLWHGMLKPFQSVEQPMNVQEEDIRVDEEKESGKQAVLDVSQVAYPVDQQILPVQPHSISVSRWYGLPQFRPGPAPEAEANWLRFATGKIQVRKTHSDSIVQSR